VKCDKDCEICHGVGYIAYDVGINDPEFGKMYPCPNGLGIEWDKNMGISVEEGNTLDWRNFNDTEAIKLLQPPLFELMQRGFGMLYVWGKPGLGKTMAIKSATIYAHYKYGMTTRYATHATLFNWLRAAYDDDRGQIEYQRRLSELERIKWLAVDEIGRDRANDFSKSTLSEILDKRYLGRIENRTCTIFIANSAPATYLDDYQVDRIMDKRNIVVHIPTSVSFRQYATELPTKEDWWKKLREVNNE